MEKQAQTGTQRIDVFAWPPPSPRRSSASSGRFRPQVHGRTGNDSLSTPCKIEEAELQDKIRPSPGVYEERLGVLEQQPRIEHELGEYAQHRR